MLTVGQKPTTPTWAGIGDFDVVWDWQQSRWKLSYYTFCTSHSIFDHKLSDGL